jgi:hypothetical protein
VDDIHAEIARYASEGLEAALYAELNDGFAFAMIDTSATLDQMIELYEPAASLTGFHALVAGAASSSSDVAPFVEMAPP